MLSIDTATSCGSIALFENHGICISETLYEKRRHSEALIEEIDRFLKVHGMEIQEIDCFAASVGPGSFTGVRVGYNTIKALSFGLRKKAYFVSTLQAMTVAVKGTFSTVYSLLDAGRDEYYVGIYALKTSSETLMGLESLKDLFKSHQPQNKIAVVGWIPSELISQCETGNIVWIPCEPHARYVGQWVSKKQCDYWDDKQDAYPSYIRKPHAATTYERPI